MSLRSESGAFDLPSIIVGVVVVGILTAGVLAAIFGVIPFAQDKAAKQDLAAVRTAEGTAKATGTDGRFLDDQGLVSHGYMEATETLGVSTDAKGTCYVGVSKSGSGNVFYSTSGSNKPKQYVSGATASDCAAEKSLEELVDQVNNPSPGTDADGDGIPDGGSAGPDDDGSSGTVSAIDLDGDNVNNAFDTSPNGETGIKLAGWGDNWGSLGTTQTGILEPTNAIIQGDLAGVEIGLLSRNVGSYHACAVTKDTNDMYCWGNDGPANGDGTGDSSMLPVKVDQTGDLAGKTITHVIANGYNTCVIADNAPYCWGDYPLFVEGNSRLVPEAVDNSAFAGKTITDLVGGNQFACVLADGAPYCWGKGGEGQLGNGKMGDDPATGRPYRSANPVAVDTSGALAGKTITGLASSNSTTCAMTNSGAYCWGSNWDGALGTGESGAGTHSAVPVAVGGPLAGKAVSVMAGGYSNMCAVAEGTTYCWGHGGSGLGDGIERPYEYPEMTHIQATPVAVGTSGDMAGKAVTQLGAGDNGRMFALADGKVYAWGNDVLSPVLVNSGVIANKEVVGLWAVASGAMVSYVE